MKTRLFILVLLSIIAMGCEEKHKQRYTTDGFDVVVIDSCEYLEIKNYNSNGYHYSVTHKGNCNNPIHYCR